MDFSYTEEQTLLRDTVARFLSERYGFEARRKAIRSEAGRDPAIWREFAELGLLGVLVPEEHGGLGGGPVEAMILMEEFGRALVVEPYLSTAIFFVSALRHAGTAKQRAEWLPAIVSGELRAALAYAEPKSRYELADVALSAKAVEGGYRLSGQKISVIGAPWSDYLLVSARTSGAQHDKDGITLFAVPRSAKGISARDFVTVDGMRASDISFENVQVAKEMVVGEVGKGLALLERLVDEGIAALSAEAAGAMKALIDQTNAYAKTRQQFGQAIGKFQVIQHRLVDMYVAYEQSVSLCLMATLKLGETDRERARAASAAKSHIGRAGAFIGQSAVQIHGGMGMTDELAASHYFKRLTMIDTMFGNADHHVRRFAALGAAA